MIKSISPALGLTGLILVLTGCADPGAVRPPVVNSGSYDWQDAFRGPNGYPLPGYEGYFKMQSN